MLFIYLFMELKQQYCEFKEVPDICTNCFFGKDSLHCNSCEYYKLSK